MTEIPVSTHVDAFVVYKVTVEVEAERQRLTAAMLHASTPQEVIELDAQRRALKDLDPQQELWPERFEAAHATHRLPRGARVLGWLDATGYRQVDVPGWYDDHREIEVPAVPVPDQAWLAEKMAELRAFSMLSRGQVR